MKKASETLRARKPAAAGKVEPHLGETLRQLRAERNLSVRTLARRAGFSASFISQVELNRVSPSIASLERLATALGVTLGHLFRQPTASGPTISRAGRRPPLTSWWSRARIEPLTPMGAGQPFEAMMITIAGGGASGKRPHSQAGHQFAIVFEGELELTLGQEMQTLARGDGVTFDAGIPHRWANPGKAPARLVMVSSRFSA